MKGNKKPIIAIRVDGNEYIGTGHLVRCMCMARALEKQGAHCVFFVAQEQAGAFVREKGFECMVLNTDYSNMEAELPELIKVAKEYAPKLWLVDSYQVTREYLRGLGQVYPVVHMDDTGDLVFESDGLINYNIYGEEMDYESKCSPQMRLLLGAKYAPVKEEFTKIPYRISEDVQNVLITMGGSDKLNITGKFCQCLLKCLPENIHFTLICGRFNPHLQELTELQKMNSRVQVLVDVPDMWNKLAMADVAISAGGTTMYELCAMGIPTVCCYYVENQRRVAEGFASGVQLCNLGDFSKEPDIVLSGLSEAVSELVENRELREELSKRMKSIVDGHGAERIAKWLLETVKCDIG